jgi:thiol-disulfide isomerase/thioredoxin
LKIRHLIIALLICSFGFQSFSQTLVSANDTPRVIDFETLQRDYLNLETDDVLVINFWATWCVPCIEELPHFEKITAEYADKKVRVVLVSLDSKKHFDTKLIPFLKKNKIKSEVVLMSDKRGPNDWIPLVYEEWSGTIPATIIIKGDLGQFYETSFETYEDLENLIKPLVAQGGKEKKI